MLWNELIIVILGTTGSLFATRLRRRDILSKGLQDIVNTDKCPFPCTCPTKAVCDDCLECPKQLGEPCNHKSLCDHHRGLVCRFLHDGDTYGICREDNGVPCVVYNRTYHHGETFTVDCRTQCVCQNGTYGCSSLCPQEHLSPKGTCMHPRLVEIPGQCCREWMCDGPAVEQPPPCQPSFSRWSPCTSDCGAGLSTRGSNLNARCLPATEMRICQTRRCEDMPSNIYQHRNTHHLRRGHECKATHRLSAPVYFRFGPCHSRKRFRPKYCGRCSLPGMACDTLLSTTVKVDFLCEESPPGLDNIYSTPLTPLDKPSATETLPEYLEAGEDLWTDERPPPWDTSVTLRTLSVQWLLKCTCTLTPTTTTAASSTDVALDGGDVAKSEKHHPHHHSGRGWRNSHDVILHRVHRTTGP